MSTEKDYVLGTHDAEIARLGLQHRVWASRVTDAWRRAGFRPGQLLLDVGCGPGWAALDLAEIVEAHGRVMAVDRSRRFLDHLEAAARVRGLANVVVRELDLDEEPLGELGAHGVWSRWVYAFVHRPREVLASVVAATAPGGTLVLHEYVDYRSWRLSPRSEPFEWFVAEVMASWREAGGEPDIALELPRWLDELGCDVLERRAIVEVATTGDYTWEWPRAFVDVGLKRLVELGRIDGAKAREVWADWERVESTRGAFLMTPMVLEIVARKRKRSRDTV